jgi:membrane-associated phospholipid phosphatase
MASSASSRLMTYRGSVTSDHPTQVLPTMATRPNRRAPGPVPVTLTGTVTRTHGSVAAVPPGLRLAALAVALAAAVGVYAVWRFFVASRTGQIIDAYAYEGAYTGRTQLWTLAEPFLDLVSNASIVIGTGTIAGIALLRRRWMVAVQAVVVIAGANITTQILKRYVFERPAMGDAGWWGNSLPSGHTTVAASVSVALLLAVPRAARPIMAVVGTIATSAIGE